MSAQAMAGAAMMFGGNFLKREAAKDAQKKVNEAVMRAIARQSAFQNEAAGLIDSRMNDFDYQNRVNKQGEIENTLSGYFVDPIQAENEQMSRGSTAVGNVSQEYSRAKAAADLNVMKNAQHLARLMSKIQSAAQLRNDEGNNLLSTAGKIDMLGNFSRGQASADQGLISASREITSKKAGWGNFLEKAGQGMMASGGKMGGRTTPAPVTDHSTRWSPPS